MKNASMSFLALAILMMLAASVPTAKGGSSSAGGRGASSGFRTVGTGRTGFRTSSSGRSSSKHTTLKIANKYYSIRSNSYAHSRSSDGGHHYLGGPCCCFTNTYFLWYLVLSQDHHYHANRTASSAVGGGQELLSTSGEIEFSAAELLSNLFFGIECSEANEERLHEIRFAEVNGSRSWNASVYEGSFAVLDLFDGFLMDQDASLALMTNQTLRYKYSLRFNQTLLSTGNNCTMHVELKGLSLQEYNLQ